MMMASLNLLFRNAENIGPARFQVRHFISIDIEARYFKTGLGKKQRKRQPNISESNDSDLGCAALKALEALLGNLGQDDLVRSQHV
jgi:hypothetical protein